MPPRSTVALLLPALVLAGCAAPNAHPPGHAMDASSPDDALTPTSRSIRGLYPATGAGELVVPDGGTASLETRYVTHDPGVGRPIRMMAYNGALPGPTFRVPQHANITVELTNGLDQATTVHWHGLRLDNAQDGVPGATQDPVPPGGSFTYRLRFPDEGLFWYHPHVREDMQQELGLYGAILVEGPEQERAPREIVLLLDDILLNGDDVALLYEESANSAAMGRYGNRLLANMRADWKADAEPGELVRLQLVNTANARPIDLAFPGAKRVDLVALDAGHLERPTPIESLVLAPAERATLDVRLPASGNVTIVNARGANATFATLVVDPTLASASASTPLEPHARAAASMRDALARAPAELSWDLRLHAGFDPAAMGAGHGGGHPSDAAGPSEPIEWENENALADTSITAADAPWRIVDARTGEDAANTTYRFEAGTIARLRITNPTDDKHPMQHPIHLHGQRFLVASVDGKPNAPMAWKDTVLVPAGATVELLVEMSNPGAWMIHCHINEHLEAGMHATFNVG